MMEETFCLEISMDRSTHHFCQDLELFFLTSPSLIRLRSSLEVWILEMMDSSILRGRMTSWRWLMNLHLLISTLGIKYLNIKQTLFWSSIISICRFLHEIRLWPLWCCCWWEEDFWSVQSTDLQDSITLLLLSSVHPGMILT